MLDARVNRRPISRLASAATVAAFFMLTIPVSSIAAAQVLARVAGTIVDPAKGAVAGVRVVLTDVKTQAKYEVSSDRTGRYEFAGVPPGEYLLEARFPGFTELRGKLSVGGQDMQRNLELEVGTLSETITISARHEPGAPAHHPQPSRAFPARARETPPCESTPSRDGTAIGGDIRPPAKLVDVRPHYPASMVSAGIEGTVVLQGRIGTGGTIEELNVISAPHADLASAAAEAVRQWQFAATLLNCVPVPVTINVTANFHRER